MAEMSVPLSKDELEALIRRVVREELLHLVPAAGSPLLDDQRREGRSSSVEGARLLRKDAELTTKKQEERQQLRAAAEALLSDYAEEGELTAFTVLDSEEFHVQG
jgi:hypothetical protein